MRKNENTVVKGKKTILIPYEKEHVPKYHEWMKSEEIQYLTASEPLTLEQEYQMQQSWREDDDKCTFIILDGGLYERNQNEIDSMIGDTNMFLQDDRCAEIEVMIAEKDRRGKGLGKEALLLMMAYGVEELGIHKFVAKIKMKNNSSQQLFKKLGFIKVDESSVFEEITYHNIVNSNEWYEYLKNEGVTFAKSCRIPS